MNFTEFSLNKKYIYKLKRIYPHLNTKKIQLAYISKSKVFMINCKIIQYPRFCLTLKVINIILTQNQIGLHNIL
jgi:hypothetical protein